MGVAPDTAKFSTLLTGAALVAPPGGDCGMGMIFGMRPRFTTRCVSAW